jgi:lipoprotein NlpI
MMKLEASRPFGLRASTYLSTHPETEERIALFGGLTPADESAKRFSRGVALAGQLKYREALVEFDAAIKGDPKLGQAYLQRSQVRTQLGESEGALADLYEAVRLGVDEKSILSSRAHLHWTLAHYEEAMHDFDEILAGPGTHASAYRGRAMLYYGQGDWTRAEADLKSYFARVDHPLEEYGEFFRFLVRRHQGAAANEAAFKDIIDRWPSGWAKSVGEFLAGQITESELLARTKNGTKPTHDERLCEAYYYIGETHLLAGERAVAVDFFDKCVGTKVAYYYEYKLARDELAAIRAEN